MKIRCLGTDEQGRLYPRYTANGEGINPPVEIRNIPSDAHALVVVVSGSEGCGTRRTHWVAYNFAPRELIEPGTSEGEWAVNDFERKRYSPPAMIPTRRYTLSFDVYALDSMLDIGGGKGKRDVLSALSGKVLARDEDAVVVGGEECLSGDTEPGYVSSGVPAGAHD